MSANHRNELTKVAIHQSLVRPMLFMGGERTLVIVSMMFAGYMGYMLTMRYGIWWGVPVGGSLWLVMIYMLRRMALADSQMWEVLQRAKKNTRLSILRVADLTRHCQR
ncbi:VirB3 family type IV secretion system protein [Undibacterium arcticum]